MARGYQFDPRREREPQRERKRIDASSGVYANPKENIGALDGPKIPGQGLTPKDDWAAQFKPRLASPWSKAPMATTATASLPTSGGAPVQLGAPSAAASLPTGSGPQGFSGFNFGASASPLSTPPASALPIMAAGGTTHAQRWGNIAQVNQSAGGWQTGNPLEILNKYQTPGTTASFTPPTNQAKPKYRWGA